VSILDEPTEERSQGGKMAVDSGVLQFLGKKKILVADHKPSIEGEYSGALFSIEPVAEKALQVLRVSPSRVLGALVEQEGLDALF
jgi:hypothetical protein